MILITFPESADGKQVIQLEVSRLDVLNAKLSPRDFALANECAESTSIADKFLWLEILARAIERGAA